MNKKKFAFIAVAVCVLLALSAVIVGKVILPIMSFHEAVTTFAQEFDTANSNAFNVNLAQSMLASMESDKTENFSMDNPAVSALVKKTAAAYNIHITDSRYDSYLDFQKGFGVTTGSITIKVRSINFPVLLEQTSKKFMTWALSQEGISAYQTGKEQALKNHFLEIIAQGIDDSASQHDEELTLQVHYNDTNRSWNLDDESRKAFIQALLPGFSIDELKQDGTFDTLMEALGSQNTK